MRGSHGLPPSLLGPIGKRFRRQTVPHLLTPEACPTRLREVLRLVAPLAPVPKAQDRRSNNCPVHHERDELLAATVIDSSSHDAVQNVLRGAGEPTVSLVKLTSRRARCAPADAALAVDLVTARVRLVRCPELQAEHDAWL